MGCVFHSLFVFAVLSLSLLNQGWGVPKHYLVETKDGDNFIVGTQKDDNYVVGTQDDDNIVVGIQDDDAYAAGTSDQGKRRNKKRRNHKKNYKKTQKEKKIICGKTRKCGNCKKTGCKKSAFCYWDERDGCTGTKKYWRNCKPSKKYKYFGNCDHLQGDCDKDRDCMGGLTCGRKNCIKQEGTKKNYGDNIWDSSADCCTYKLDMDHCSPGNKCGKQRGPCRKDEDCKAHLKCSDECSIFYKGKNKKAKKMLSKGKCCN